MEPEQDFYEGAVEAGRPAEEGGRVCELERALEVSRGANVLLQRQVASAMDSIDRLMVGVEKRQAALDALEKML